MPGTLAASMGNMTDFAKVKDLSYISAMNIGKQQALLEALTPEIRAYLFPGLSHDEPEQLCCQATPALSEEEACYDLAEPAPKSFRIFRKAASCAEKAAEPIGTKWPISTPDQLDPKTEALLKEIERIQKEYGVSIEDIEMLLGYRVTLSPMHITHSGKIFLVDFDNVEVKMDNVSKALYFLYLKHPAGIKFKDVANYREELLQIYRSICGRDDPAEIEKSIDHLADPLGNALNVASSRIKIAFRNVVSDRVAKFYYINGLAREDKKVPLDRDLVIWL